MSSIITSAINLTFGLLWNKVRDHTANQLKEGDMTDEKMSSVDCERARRHQNKA